MTNAEFMRMWYQRVWIEADNAAIDEMMAEHPYVEGLDAETFSDRASFKLFHKMATTIMRFDAFEFARLIAAGEEVAAGVRLRAKLLLTGQEVEILNHVMVRIVDGRIVEGHNLADYISVFEQIGVMPPNTLQRCLTGQRLSFVGGDQMVQAALRH